MNDVAKKAMFSGEVQFAGYSDSSRGGPKVTLRLSDRADLERFIGMEGRRFMTALVLISDGETPEEPQPAASAPKEHKPRARMTPLCEWAVLRCAEPSFQQWASGIAPAARVPETLLEEARSDEDKAKAVICWVCDVRSRKDLDTNQVAAQRFHERIRVPYSEWLREHQ